MRKKTFIIAGVLCAVLAAGGLGIRAWRGPVGADGLPASAPEFSSLEASRWVGAPISLASTKGEIVFVEGWSPG